MNNIDIHDIQLWAVALVGSFYNNLRKIPAHKRTTSVFKSVNNLEPLHCTVHGCTEPKETDGLYPGVCVCLKTHTHSVLRLFSNNVKKCVFYETVF